MFLLSPSQKRGFFAFLLIVVAVICGKYWLKTSENNEKAYSLDFPEGEQKAEIQVFVNTADTTQWAKLPFIGAVLSKRIVKYREMIGGFASLDEVQKVYGLKPETFEKIQPFLVLDSIPSELKKAKKDYTQFADKYPDKKEKEEIPVLDINTASEGDFALLPGIGTVLSERIVKFRDAKKGFRSVEEVGKVFGLKPEVFAQIQPYLQLKTAAQATTEKPAFAEKTYPEKAATESKNFPENPTSPKKSSAIIDLNKATEADLQQVAGIGEYTAKQIVFMREAIGGFADLSHLKFVKGISEENFQKMKPFLQISPVSKKNINKISAYDLQKYPSLQKETANKLINYRKINGYFKTWEDVAKAEGVTPEMLGVMKAYFVME